MHFPEASTRRYFTEPHWTSMLFAFVLKLLKFMRNSKYISSVLPVVSFGLLYRVSGLQSGECIEWYISLIPWLCRDFADVYTHPSGPWGLGISISTIPCSSGITIKYVTNSIRTFEFKYHLSDLWIAILSYQWTIAYGWLKGYQASF